MRKFFLISLSLVVGLILILTYAVFNRDNLSSYASYIGPLVPEKFKIYIKDNIFIFDKLDNQKIIIEKQEKKINKLSLATESKFRNKNLKISFNQIDDKKTINFNKNNFKFKKFSTSSMITGKWEVAGGSFYLEKFQNNLIVVSATGIISYGNIDFYDQNHSTFSSIKSNLETLILDPKFFVHSPFGIKDALIFEDYLYISFTNLIEENCYNTSILRAKINFEALIFENYFIPRKCVKMNNDYGNFSAHQSGGRMKIYNDKKIIFTVGDYGFRDHSQNIDQTTFGKTILIDSDGKNFDILSIGHRNHQGLYYDKFRSKIYMTEHGPQGGDEVNVNNLDSEKIKNYGWPISSYGEHYYFKERKDDHPYYIQAPLYKSHSKYGFIEPLKYFTPSIGISEIILINKNIYDDNYYLLFGALGNNVEEGDMSVHVLTLDENDKILSHDIIELKERIRDILKFDDGNLIFFSLETSSSIGIMKKL